MRRTYAMKIITIHNPPTYTLFPYTTLFQSPAQEEEAERGPEVQQPDALVIGRRQPALEAASLRSEEHTSELQSHHDLVCRLLLEKKMKQVTHKPTVCI